VEKPGTSGKFPFPPRERLKGREEIREVFSRRRTVSCSGARLLLLKNGLSYNRIAFTFSRKFGNAVQRNRAKRTGREVYRHLRNELRLGYDLVLLVYPGDNGFEIRMAQLRELFNSAGLFKKSEGQEIT
jgi:ribonuclease P protein component